MIYTIKDKGNRITEIIKSCKTMQQCESCSNMINNLAKDDSVSMVNEMSRTENNNLKLDDSALEEITSIISQKKNEAEHYKINSERALKASESLSLKVASVNNEISAYEEKLKILSQMQ